jgi:4-alpha-glucanotransferase
MVFKRSILEELARTFFSKAGSERQNAFEEFKRQQQSVDEYARFRAVTDRMRSGWTSWPDRLQNGSVLPADYNEADYHYHLYSQWIVQEQLKTLSSKARSKGHALYLDLPLGLHPDSFDVWQAPNIFLRSLSGGAPPDIVFTKGQNWGFPPMHPEALRRDQYRYTIAYIRNHLRFAQLLRIDHVMGLHRLYCIPDGQTGEKGVYIEYPFEELYAILSLESHRNKAGIVGENLGTVPPKVNAATARHNIQQMYVVQYEIFGDLRKAVLRTPPRNSVASLNTHDMPPFRAFWDALDIDDRVDLKFINQKIARKERIERRKMKTALVHFLRKQGLLKTSVPPPEAVFEALFKFLSASRSNVVLANLEDLWQETQPQNVPATQDEHPNWRRRLRYSMEEMREMPQVAGVLKRVFACRNSRQ